MGDLFQFYDENSCDGFECPTLDPDPLKEEEDAAMKQSRALEKLLRMVRTSPDSGAKSKMRELLAAKIAPEAFESSTDCYRIDPPTVSVHDFTSLIKRAQVHVTSDRVSMMDAGKPSQRPRFQTCGDLVDLPCEEIRHIFKAMRHNGNLNLVVLMFDDARVAPAKGAQHYKRSKQSRKECNAFAEELMARERCTPQQWFGDRFYDRGYMFLTAEERQQRLDELDRTRPKSVEILEERARIEKCRPLCELLRTDAEIPGRFETMMSDRALGKPAVMRFLFKAMIFDAQHHVKLEPGHRVILCGHNLMPEDLYTEEAIDELIAAEEEADTEEEAYHRIAYRIMHTPVLLFHSEDCATVEEFFGADRRQRYEQDLNEDNLAMPNLRPVISGDAPQFALLHDFRHVNGEVDQSAFFMMRKLSQYPMRHSTFEYVTSDSDAVLTAGPFFYIQNYLIPSKKDALAHSAPVTMPHIFNFYGVNPAKVQVCDLRLLVTAVTAWARKLPYFANEKVIATQTIDAPKDRFAFLRTFTEPAEKSHRAEALIHVADTAADRKMVRMGANRDDESSEAPLDLTIPICLHVFAALALNYTDYSRAWAGLGPVKFIDALTNFSDQCMPMMEWSKPRVGDGRRFLQLVPGSALRYMLVVMAHGAMSAFNTKALKAKERATWAKGEKNKQNAGTSMRYHLPRMTCLEILHTLADSGEDNVEGLERILQFPEYCMPEDETKYKWTANQVSKLPRTTEEIIQRLLNTQYYFYMLQQTGRRYIQYPEALLHGFDVRDASRPIGARNMRHAYEFV